MKTAKEMEAAIVGKATEDEDFRDRLLDDPRGTIEQELGISIPETVEIEVHEESSTTAHLVLPPASKLSGAELEAVAGGVALFGKHLY